MGRDPKDKPTTRQVSARNNASTTGAGNKSSGGNTSRNMAPGPGQGRSQAPSGPPRPPRSGPAGGGSRGGRDYYGRDYGPPPPRDYRNVRPRPVQPQRDPFPYIMGGIIGALVVGLGVVVILLLNNRNSGGVAGNPPPVQATVASGAATAAGDTPPRMPMDQFKALYDDPNKRPLILDVRDANTFAAGHIAGAESFPESDVANRVNELPKDKLIVAYCQ